MVVRFFRTSNAITIVSSITSTENCFWSPCQDHSTVLTGLKPGTKYAILAEAKLGNDNNTAMAFVATLAEDTDNRTVSTEERGNKTGEQRIITQKTCCMV